jgi:hypothetical protein
MLAQEAGIKKHIDHSQAGRVQMPHPNVYSRLKDQKSKIRLHAHYNSKKKA